MAVYTDVSFEDLERFLAGYAVGEAQVFKGIAEGVENSNYYLQTDRASYILTLYEKRVHASDLPFFLGLMQHLARAGLKCPTPVADNSGKLSGKLNGRPAALLTFLDGISLRRPDVAQCHAGGRALAELHQAGEGFALKRKNALGPAGWARLTEDCAPRADTVAHGMRKLIESETEDVSRSWPTGLPSGLIHADLFPDNVLFLDNQVSGVIDFYFACNDTLAYDIAVMMNSWCFEADGAFNVTKCGSLLAGYQAVRALEAIERDALPALARGAALRFLLTRLYDWLNHVPGAMVRPKDPKEFARRLRFHRGVKNSGAYGL